MKKKLWLAGLIIFSLVMMAEGSGPKAAGQPRNFVLFFETVDYTRELGDAVTFFFNEVLEPNDQLIIYSPARAYGFSKNTLAKPKRELSAAMQEKLRGDIAACSANYKIIINDMKVQVRAIENTQTIFANEDPQVNLKDNLTMYRQNINNLQALRKINESLLMQIVNLFKAQQGNNHMVMIYGAEFRPIPNKETLRRLREIPVVAFEVAELFSSDDQKTPLDAEKFIDIFTKTPITLHFLYIKPKDTSAAGDYKEQSTDMYDVFTKIAKATGGIVETTAKPEAALKSLVQAISESEK
ncbi:MAG: hypothetical protein WCC06_12435 [Candidatus Aminicenantales bacterium]